MISNAYAQTAGGAASVFSLESPLIWPIVMVVVFYFLLIRPQQKRAKEQRAMMDGLKSGDEVITSGGVLGKITKVMEQYVLVEVAQAGAGAVELLVQRSAVQAILPKGTIKAL